MAKKITTVTSENVDIPVWALFSDPTKNYGRMHSQFSGEEAHGELRESLKLFTWRPNDRVECIPMTGEEKAHYLALRVAEHEQIVAEALKMGATEADRRKKIVWETMFLDPKTNKVRPPQYLVATGNQRFSEVVNASILRYEEGCKFGWGTHGVEAPRNADGELLNVQPTAMPEAWCIMTIPMVIREFKSRIELIEAAVEENSMKLIGHGEMTHLDKALAGRELLRERRKINPNLPFPKEAEMGRWLHIPPNKRGAVQDVYAIIKIDEIGGEDLNYLDRCCLKPEDPLYLNWSWRLTEWTKGTRADTRAMINRMDPAWIEKETAAAKRRGKPHEAPVLATKAEFVEYFNFVPSTAEVERVKRNTNAECEEAAKESGIEFLKEFMSSAAEGKINEFVDKYAPFARVLNAVVKVCEHTDATELVEDSLTQLVELDPNAATAALEKFYDDLTTDAQSGDIIDAELIEHEQPKLEHFSSN